MASQRWIPLEANPAVLNKYLGNLGVSKDWQFVDVFGLETELLCMVPKPVVAVMLLYPLNDKVDATKIGTVDTSYNQETVYFMKQSIPNACGTVALVHALANNEKHITFEEDKHFKVFLENTKGLSPEDKGVYLENDKKMGAVHEENALEGDTQAPPRDTKVNPHFISFVNVGGTLYEMDGRKEAPVNHGSTTGDLLLEDAIAVVKGFMARDPEEINFSLIALAKAD